MHACFDIVLIAGAYDTKLGDPRWNVLADIAPPIDKINIFDIVAAAVNFGKSW